MEAARNPEEEAKAMASMRLAYQDLSLQQKKEEERLKKLDPSKAAQIERLGMGFGGGLISFIIFFFFTFYGLRRGL
jgi:CRISPR/Cas system CSM-associated protein Csm5 (group 7 of RAMP superfamily)